MKNYGITVRLRNEPLDPWLRPRVISVPFRGTLTGAKAKAKRMLKKHGGSGWKAVVETDGETIYCTYN